MKTSFAQLMKFSQASKTFLSQDENHNTKLAYALKRITSQLEKIQAEYFQRRDDIMIDNAAVDENKVLLVDDKGNFRYTQEGLKTRNRALRELETADVLEIEPYFATDVPELSDELREAFAGLVIKEEHERLEIVA